MCGPRDFLNEAGGYWEAIMGSDHGQPARVTDWLARQGQVDVGWDDGAFQEAVCSLRSVVWMDGVYLPSRA